MNKVNIPIANCLDCPHHKLEMDPDPLDWFCDNDEKTVCGKANRVVTSGNRPYETRANSLVPKWCPLKETE